MKSELMKGKVTTWTECRRCGKNSERSMEFLFASETAPRHVWTAFPCPLCGEQSLVHMRRDSREVRMSTADATEGFEARC